MLLVIGNLAWDRHIYVDELPLPNQDSLVLETIKCPSGAAGNVAASVAQFGQQVGLMACLGEDEAGDALVSNITLFGVNTIHLKRVKAPTSEFIVVIGRHGNRNFYLNPEEAAFQLKADYALEIDWRYVSGIAFVGCRLNLAERILSFLPTPKIGIYANIGFWIASQELKGTHTFLLDKFECIFANRQELEMAPEAIRTLLTSGTHLYGAKQFIVTDGSGASAVYTANALVEVKPKPIPRIVNTLGCGDAFMGAYLASHLKGLSPTVCSEIAHDWAAKIAQLPCERSVELSTTL